jgi:hypothetical protein
MNDVMENIDVEGKGQKPAFLGMSRQLRVPCWAM